MCVLLTDVPVLRPPLPLPLLSPSLACSWTVYRGVIGCMPFCVSCSGTVLHLSKSQHPLVYITAEAERPPALSQTRCCLLIK